MLHNADIQRPPSRSVQKEIARAAFLSVILSAEYSPEDAQALLDLASGTRDEDGNQDQTTDRPLSSE